MDIGGTNTVFGIVESRGNVLATDSVKTQSFSKIEDYVCLLYTSGENQLWGKAISPIFVP